MTTVVVTRPSELPNGAGTLLEVVEYYDKALGSLQVAVDAALADIEKNPSDPGALARYQGAQSDYVSFKNFLSALIKSLRDLDASIIRNIG